MQIKLRDVGNPAGLLSVAAMLAAGMGVAPLGMGTVSVAAAAVATASLYAKLQGSKPLDSQAHNPRGRG